MSKVRIFRSSDFNTPTGNSSYLVSKPVAGVVPKKTVVIVLNKETWHARTIQAATRLKYEKPMTDKNGNFIEKYGKINLISPLRFNADGSTQPFEFQLPTALEREVELGETELHIVFDLQGHVSLGSDALDKIAQHKRKIWRTGAT